MLFRYMPRPVQNLIDFVMVLFLAFVLFVLWNAMYAPPETRNALREGLPVAQERHPDLRCMIDIASHTIDCMDNGQTVISYTVEEER